MASSAPDLLRAAGPLVRAAARAARNPSLRAAVAHALRRLDTAPAAGVARGPLTPAALRFERARSVGKGERADQTAVTVWFGVGPALPGPGGGGDALRGAVRIGAGVLGTAALAAMTVIAARKEETRTRVIDAAVARPRSAEVQPLSR